jgi:hypothetical protein
MKNQARFMKNMDSSDINSMVRPSLNIAAVRPAMPVNTSPIWGTYAIGGTGRPPVSSAIWGTCARSAPMQQVPKPLPSVMRSS